MKDFVKIIGILNVSPESFSGDGMTERSVIMDRVREMVNEGVHIIDIGAQSTKPGPHSFHFKTS